DPAMSLRGWPAFLHAVEAARVKAGASWIGAPTYGIAAQFAASPHIHAPAVEFYERERFTFETPAERADFSKPGLIVVPGRGAGAGAMRGCFASVQMLPEIDRGAGRGMTRYAVFRAEARHPADRVLPAAAAEVLIDPAPRPWRDALQLAMAGTFRQGTGSAHRAGQAGGGTTGHGPSGRQTGRAGKRDRAARDRAARDRAARDRAARDRAARDRAA